MALSKKKVEEFGAALYESRRTRIPIQPLTDSEPAMDVMDAYAVQQALVRRLISDGNEIIGYKLGLTSEPMQRMLGVDRPDYGPVLSTTVYAEGEAIPADRFIAPKVEAEIAFVLSSDLSGPDATARDALRATAGVVAAMEIVDSRIADWRIKLPDTIADLASNGGVTLSARMIPIDDIDVRLIGMVFTKNGELVATGAGAAAMGDPAAAVAWLANTLHPMGITLPAGAVIMTGALHAAVSGVAGDVFRADFDRIGPVTARLV
jgi:2-keto-4-pentenoate hydratase